jgi:hypothetical protein
MMLLKPLVSTPGFPDPHPRAHKFRLLTGATLSFCLVPRIAYALKIRERLYTLLFDLRPAEVM